MVDNKPDNEPKPDDESLIPDYEKIVSYVEDLTFKTLHEINKPKLRLAK